MPPNAEIHYDEDDSLLTLLAEALDGRDETRIALLTRLCLLGLGTDLDPMAVKRSPSESPADDGSGAKIDKVNPLI